MKKYPLLTKEDATQHALLAAVLLKKHRAMPISKIHAILDGVDECVGTRGVKTERLKLALKKN